MALLRVNDRQTPEEISYLRAKCDSGEVNPRNAKVDLAKSIITDFHSSESAANAEEEFIRRFVEKEIPDDIEEVSFAAGDHKIVELMVETGLTSSKGEAKRLIEQGGVRINGEKASNTNEEVTIGGEPTLVQVGKRKFLNIVAG